MGPIRLVSATKRVLVDEDFLEAHGVCGVDVFRVVCNEGFDDGLGGNVHLECGPSTIGPATDVEGDKLVFTDDENRLADF